MDYEWITKEIIGSAMKVHRVLGPGFLETVYARALAHELERSGLPFEIEKPIAVHYRELVVGQFFADMYVADKVMVELKAIQSLAIAHELQLVNYLTATRMDVGLLLNFGAERLEFKRKHRKPLPNMAIRRRTLPDGL